MHRARNALAERASAAASSELVQLEELVQVLSRNEIKDEDARSSLVQIARALGYDEFALDVRGLPPSERLRRIEVGVVEVCKEQLARSRSGIPVNEIAQTLSKRQKRRVTPGEVQQAVINMQSCFGPGLAIETPPNGEPVIRSDSVELSSEQGDVLVACDALGYVTVEMLTAELQWTRTQAQMICNAMVSSGLFWIDEQASPVRYWVP